jgi:hypothetical protein
MKDNKPIKITLSKDEDCKLELTLPWDADLDNMEEAFRLILKWMTFPEDLADEMFGHNEFGEVLEEEDEK